MHGAVQVSEDGRLVYVSTELSNTLIAVPADPGTGSLGEIASVTSLLPEGYDGPPTTASHVELSPCGGFAYVGNRVGVDLDGVSPRRFPNQGLQTLVVRCATRPFMQRLFFRSFVAEEVVDVGCC